MINESNRKEGILTEIAPNDPNDLIKIIQEEIKNNIFFIDLETDRNTKYNRSLEILYSYEKSAFWWGLVPILDDYLSKLSRIRMINKISEIYKSVVLKRIKEKNIKEYNKGERKTFVDLKYTAYLLPIQILLKSFENQIFTQNLGIKVINEFDKEYAEINIIDRYYNIAKRLDNNFNTIKTFSSCFKNKFWYDIKIH